MQSNPLNLSPWDLRFHGQIQMGGQEVRTPLKNHKNIGFPSDIDLDPLKITKLPSQHSLVFCWRADDGPLLVAFRSSPSHQVKKKERKKIRCQCWTPSDKTFWIQTCVLLQVISSSNNSDI